VPENVAHGHPDRKADESCDRDVIRHGRRHGELGRRDVERDRERHCRQGQRDGDPPFPACLEHDEEHADEDSGDEEVVSGSRDDVLPRRERLRH
jgi:hypothetical protein